MSLKDNDERKWEYTQHAKIKHLLLSKYLTTWITILGSNSPLVCYFDGFAGRGNYNDGNYGSPILALEAMEQVRSTSHIRGLKYNCFFIESDLDNFNNLDKVIEQERGRFPSVNSIKCINADFDSYINELLDKYDRENKSLAPSFFFIDPFGYTGLSFYTIQRILRNPGAEVFINFMVRDVNRFLSLPNQVENMNMLFGGDSWKELASYSGKERQDALRDLYMNNLLESGSAKYVWPFRICEDDRCATLYYLIYATNHFKGLDVMKGIMYNQSSHFAFLGPEDHAYQISKSQLKLFDYNTEDLKVYLLNRYKNISKTYDGIRRETYMETLSIDKHYRAAIKELEKERIVRVTRISSKKNGIAGNDLIHFDA